MLFYNQSNHKIFLSKKLKQTLNTSAVITGLTCVCAILQNAINNEDQTCHNGFLTYHVRRERKKLWDEA